MRLFQNSGVYPTYRPRLAHMTRGLSSFAAARDAFLADRYGACHFLKPVLDGEPEAFFTNGDDESLQRKWAREQGLPRTTALSEILLAQIEHHHTEVFYNLDPMRYSSAFVLKLPGCVKRAIAWRAAPSPGADFSAYSLVVCNFPSILRSYEEKGWHSAYFAPAHDPEMDQYAANAERPVDVIFVGGYSRHHRRRAEILEAVAARHTDLKVIFHLDQSRLNTLAESVVGQLLPLAKHRRPSHIRAVSASPVFGRELYWALSRAKIVLNGAVDMAGDDRGNMRCFEAMGCGCLLLSDTGDYPDGMCDGETMVTYGDGNDAVTKIAALMQSRLRVEKIATAGTAMIRSQYSKQDQWERFCALL